MADLETVSLEQVRGDNGANNKVRASPDPARTGQVPGVRLYSCIRRSKRRSFVRNPGYTGQQQGFAGYMFG